jgi:hypothetical protein
MRQIFMNSVRQTGRLPISKKCAEINEADVCPRHTLWNHSYSTLRSWPRNIRTVEALMLLALHFRCQT